MIVILLMFSCISEFGPKFAQVIFEGNALFPQLLTCSSVLGLRFLANTLL